MSRWLPHPFLTLFLLIVWIMLNGLSVAHFVLGSLIASGASRAMAVLQPAKPRLSRLDLIVRLFLDVLIDILRSNIALTGILLRGKRTARVSGFVSVPLELRDHNALAVLACIITSTPGTAWIEYQSANSSLLIHVLDLMDERQLIKLIKQRYEQPLMEIFA
ncbi:Na+/H+ antiporter subunit E [Phyllobacterium sp. SB3]|uniref:Na+/H+ antiporter subunit E n=1 Tax=Phyllobacterium sp. SB3 TaxID=3156073 RepID=UPI0032AE88CD